MPYTVSEAQIPLFAKLCHTPSLKHKFPSTQLGEVEPIPYVDGRSISLIWRGWGLPKAQEYYRPVSTYLKSSFRFVSYFRHLLIKRTKEAKEYLLRCSTFTSHQEKIARNCAGIIAEHRQLYYERRRGLLLHTNDAIIASYRRRKLIVAENWLLWTLQNIMFYDYKRVQSGTFQVVGVVASNMRRAAKGCIPNF